MDGAEDGAAVCGRRADAALGAACTAPAPGRGFGEPGVLFGALDAAGRMGPASCFSDKSHRAVGCNGYT